MPILKPIEFAAVAGVTSQAVYRKMKDMSAELGDHIVMSDRGSKLLDEEAQRMLLAAFGKDASIIDAPVVPEEEVDADEEPEAPMDTQQDRSEVDFLRTQIERMQTQIDTMQGELTEERRHSRDQSEKLASLATELAQLTKNTQVLLQTEQVRGTPKMIDAAPSTDAPESSDADKKDGFFKRLFRR